MSILIKSMDMPTNCEECPCSYWTEGMHHNYCQAVGYDTEIHDGEKGRPTWCPLIELPPHGRLIDADALKEKAIERSEKRGEMVNVLDNVITAYDISTAPTIIPAEEEE